MTEDVKVAILFGFGINCDRETAAVFELAGATSERVHVNHFVNGDRDLSEFHILAVPGGFSFFSWNASTIPLLSVSTIPQLLGFILSNVSIVSKLDLGLFV